MSAYFDQVQEYVEGELDGEDLVAFERALATDAALRQEVKLRKEIQSTLAHQEEVADQAVQLSFLLQSKRTKFFLGGAVAKPSITRRLKLWGIGLAAAASIALILTFTGVFSSAHYGSLPTMPDYAVRSNQSKEAYSGAARAFNHKNYDEAIDELSALKNSEKNNAIVEYYLGLSYLGKKSYQKAIPHLETIASGNSIYREDANYYLGYAFYKLADDKMALSYLQKVPENSRLLKKAMKLRKKLKK